MGARSRLCLSARRRLGQPGLRPLQNINQIGDVRLERLFALRQRVGQRTGIEGRELPVHVVSGFHTLDVREQRRRLGEGLLALRALAQHVLGGSQPGLCKVGKAVLQRATEHRQRQFGVALTQSDQAHSGHRLRRFRIVDQRDFEIRLGRVHPLLIEGQPAEVGLDIAALPVLRGRIQQHLLGVRAVGRAAQPAQRHAQIVGVGGVSGRLQRTLGNGVGSGAAHVLGQQKQAHVRGVLRLGLARQVLLQRHELGRGELLFQPGLNRRDQRHIRLSDRAQRHSARGWANWDTVSDRRCRGWPPAARPRRPRFRCHFRFRRSLPHPAPRSSRRVSAARRRSAPALYSVSG